MQTCYNLHVRNKNTNEIDLKSEAATAAAIYCARKFSRNFLFWVVVFAFRVRF
jgi:hypothetical protein